MAFLEHNPAPIAECANCGHPPIHHIEDGLHATCMLCSFMAMKAAELGLNKMPKICTQRFQFRLSLAERTQAMNADRSNYEQDKLCAVCGYLWKQHWGYLCVTGDSLFIPVIEAKLPYLITH